MCSMLLVCGSKLHKLVRFATGADVSESLAGVDGLERDSAETGGE